MKLNLQPENIQTVPYRYLVQKDIIPPELYQRLLQDFPDDSRFSKRLRMSLDLARDDEE